MSVSGFCIYASVYISAIIFVEGKPFSIIKILHALMPSECGILLCNVLTSNETIRAL